MQYFLITLGALLLVITGMSVGYIFSKKELKGSCGGLGKVMGEDCDICDKKDQCDKHDEDCHDDCDEEDKEECESKSDCK